MEDQSETICNVKIDPSNFHSSIFPTHWRTNASKVHSIKNQNLKTSFLEKLPLTRTNGNSICQSSLHQTHGVHTRSSQIR